MMNRWVKLAGFAFADLERGLAGLTRGGPCFLHSGEKELRNGWNAMSSGHLGRMMLTWVVFYGDRGPSGRPVLLFGGLRFERLTILATGYAGWTAILHGTSSIARHPESRQRFGPLRRRRP
jgi:hypothetical protein